MNAKDCINDSSNLVQLILENTICDHCIGRLMHNEVTKKNHEDAGREFRLENKISKKIKSKDCQLCEGIFQEIEDYIFIINKKCEGYEFGTFLIGSRVDEDILNYEKLLMSQYNIEECESIKNDINREIGKKLEINWNKPVDFQQPDIMIIIDTQFKWVDLQIKSFYLYGRYNKFKRGIPQTKWFCRSCRGKGCRHCHYSGKLYEYSVEEYIIGPILEMTNSSHVVFHGCGREDIDVKMLGSGRPFIVEIQNPQKRKIDLKKLAGRINEHGKGNIAIQAVRPASKDEIPKLKNSSYPKVYKATIVCESPFSKEKLKKALETLRGATIQQYTPTRVARRRARKTRERRIYSCELDEIVNNHAMIIIEAESGTYIKELITGDNGRTKPNLSTLMDAPCTVAALDVLAIKGDENHGKAIERNSK